jgi:hypothetical protein
MSRLDHTHVPAAVMDIASARDPVARRRRLVRRLALLATMLMLTVVAVSAYMRLSQSGLGCDGWPACYGTPSGHNPSSLMSRASSGLAWARVTHRVVASAMLVLVLGLVALTARHRPRLRREGRLALAVLLLTLWLAGLGAAMRGVTSPAVVLGNLLGGLATLALCWRLVVVAGAGAAPAPALRRWAWAGLLLVLLQAALGGLVDARHAATTCRYAAECADIVRSAGWDWRVLSPWTCRPTTTLRARERENTPAGTSTGIDLICLSECESKITSRPPGAPRLRVTAVACADVEEVAARGVLGENANAPACPRLRPCAPPQACPCR